MPAPNVIARSLSDRRGLGRPRRHGTRPALLDARGATSVLLAVAATMLLGFAGLAVEAGGWYLSLRHAVTAADLAAIAGATARASGADYVAVARNTAALNGFSAAGEVTVGPPAGGTHTGDSTAVEVVVARQQSIGLARLFLGTPPVARARAVASSNIEENVCALALGGGLVLGGNSTTDANRCFLGSNAAAPNGIGVVGSARVRTTGLVTTGSCSGCTGGDVWTDDTRATRPQVNANRPNPITDPFAGLQTWTPAPPACLNPALDLKKGPVTLSPGSAICTSLTIGPQQALNLNPGVYYFNNASLDVQGSFSGSGVTLVFTGDPDRVGTISVNAQAKGSLTGPNGSLIPGHPEAAGLLLYRDARATNNGSANEVHLNGGAQMYLSGGLYFPTSDVVANGHSDMGSTCFSIIGYSLSFSGTADTQVDVTGCKGYTPYATLSIVRLVE
jgi:hypothetical protein